VAIKALSPSERLVCKVNRVGTDITRTRHSVTLYVHCHYPVPLSFNLGNLTSWNPLGHFRPVMGLLYLLFIYSLFLACSCNRCTDGTNNTKQSTRAVPLSLWVSLLIENFIKFLGLVNGLFRMH